MPDTDYKPYEPLNRPKPFGEKIWIVDGPEIHMDYACGTTIPFPTRMVVVEAAPGKLWLHSPIQPDEGMIAAIEELGRPTWLVAPNSLHFWYMRDWQLRFPDAVCFAVPGLSEKAAKKDRAFSVDAVLDGSKLPELPAGIDYVFAPGSLINEADFFHEASRTLILTDLIENFEPDRVKSRVLRFLLKRFGAADPDGQAPYDVQLTFLGHRKQLKAAVRQMIAWQPERVVMAHGRPYDRDGLAEITRSFRWAGSRRSPN